MMENLEVRTGPPNTQSEALRFGVFYPWTLCQFLSFLSSAWRCRPICILSKYIFIYTLRHLIPRLLRIHIYLFGDICMLTKIRSRCSSTSPVNVERVNGHDQQQYVLALDVESHG